MSVFELFQQLPLFRGVESEDLFTLIPRISLDFENYQEGDFVFQKKSKSEGIIFLIKGKVELSDNVHSKVFSENSFLSLTGLFGKIRSYASDARALTDARILIIDKKSLLYLLKQNDTIMCNYLGMLSDLAGSDNSFKYLDRLPVT